MNICVYGASSADIDSTYFEAAEELGKLLAEQGHGLVFGGGDQGLMGAIARGFHARAGRIVGIAPTFFDQPGILYPACTEFLFTETMRERKQLMEDRSDAMIVLPGGIGTYEEFMEILTLKKLKRTDKPILLFNIDHFYDPMVALLEHTVAERFMDRSGLTLYEVAETAEQAAEVVRRWAEKSD